MEYFFGIVLGLVIVVAAHTLKYDRDRSFYPVILIVIALYYVLFAFMNENTGIIITELIIALGFTAIAIVGAKISLLIIGGGLLLHGLFDLFHHQIISYPEVPEWWPGFCAGVDVVLGIGVLVLVKTRSRATFRPTAENDR